jgi:hypothetical protein
MIRQNAVQETVSPAFDMTSVGASCIRLACQQTICDGRAGRMQDAPTHASSRLSETAPQGENGLKSSATGMATDEVTEMATGMAEHAWHAACS